MSIRTLCIWIIVAGILGTGVLATRARERSAMEANPIVSSRTLGFDPALTVGIVRVAEGKREILERDQNSADRWVIHYTRDGLDRAWSVVPMKARSGIRSLATSPIELSEVDLVLSIGGELEIRQADGSSYRIVFDENSAGGYTAIRVEERSADGITLSQWYGRIARGVRDSFIGKGMLGWRNEHVFDLPNSAITTIDLQAGGSIVSLARTSNGWMIKSPYEIHGDRETIDNLVQVLLSLQSKSFVDTQVSSTTTGIDTPIAQVRLGSTDAEISLIIGGRADVDGALVYAEIESALETVLVTLETNQLAKLKVSGQAYIAQTPSMYGAGSIGSLRVLGRDGFVRFEAARPVDKWMVGEERVDSINGEAIDRLVKIITRDQASALNVLDQEVGESALGYVEIVGTDGAVLDRFAVAIDSSDTGMQTLFMHELPSGKRVVWMFDSQEAMATGAWLTAVASKRRPS